MGKSNLYDQLMSVKLGPQAVLNNARARIKSNGMKSQTDINNLEKYLNAVFYNQGALAAEYGFLQPMLAEATGQYLADQFDIAASKIDWSNMAVNGSPEANKIGVGLFDRQQSHSQYINRSTLQTRLALITEQLQKGMLPLEAAKQFKTLKQQILQALSMTTKNEVKIYVDKRNTHGDDLVNLIKQIDEAWYSLTYFDSLPFPVWLSGNIFERALQAVGTPLQNLTNNTAATLLEEVIKGTPGAEIASRGTLQKGNIAFDEEQKIMGKNGSNFRLKTIFSEKSGKMDVSLNLPQLSNTPFRISAKNWSSLGGSHDFGSTSLLAALLRTTDLRKALGYAVQVDLSKEVSQIEIAHEFAKACIIVDIVMGYSQEQNCADTIVINDRSSGRIRVYSVSKILGKIKDKLKTFPIIGYNETVVKDFFDNSKPISDQIPHALSQMHAINVAVGSNILQL